ncbi:MAG TPA: SDR family oxidoreductase [Arenibaculum sp.]|nr:SDR family oxidoreductase [Arenibaculum sp.]
MIVVTGATGNVGSEVVRQLKAKGAAFKVLVRDAAKARTAFGDVVAVEGDYDEPGTLGPALAGAEKVFLLSPAHERMVAHQSAVIDAAKAAGVKHIVKMSGLGASIEAPARLPHHHAEIEALITKAGIARTSIRPNLFMQVLLGSAPSIIADGAIYAPAGQGRISFTDVRDIAAVAVAALTTPGHAGKDYDITGPEALTYAEVAEILSVPAGRPVAYIDAPVEVARDSMLGAGMPAWLTEAFLELFAIYRADMGSAVNGTIEQVLGRKPYDFKTFAADHADAFRASSQSNAA